MSDYDKFILFNNKESKKESVFNDLSDDKSKEKLEVKDIVSVHDIFDKSHFKIVNTIDSAEKNNEDLVSILLDEIKHNNDFEHELHRKQQSINNTKELKLKRSLLHHEKSLKLRPESKILKVYNSETIEQRKEDFNTLFMEGAILNNYKNTHQNNSNVEGIVLYEEKDNYIDTVYIEAERMSKEIYRKIQREEFEVGYFSKTGQYFKEKLEANRLISMTALNKCLMDNFEKSDIVYGIFSIISEFEYEEMYPEAVSMLLNGGVYDDDNVKEAVVRIFEHWCNEDSLRLIQKVKFSDPWLEDYKNEVIEDIKESI
ncbi:MAG: hypothetical protein N4A40_12985 [Tissierellales bacterium]|jgi:hypothetical protein|nr:hypothetical protein [Tissierellales bacterium]